MNGAIGVTVASSGAMSVTTKREQELEGLFPLVQLLVSVVLVLFGISFTYFYAQMNGWRSPLAAK